LEAQNMKKKTDNIPENKPDEQSVAKSIAVDKGSYEKNNKSKLISGLIFLIAMTVLVFVLFLSLGELGQIEQTVMQIAQGQNYIYLIIAFIFALLFFFIFSLSLAILGKKMGSEAKFGDVYLVACSEYFFNDITPFSAGGQPFQIYSLTKKGLTSGTATGLVLTNFIIFLTTVNLYNTASLFFFPQYVSSMEYLNLPWLKGVSLIGFIFNYFFWAFIIALGFSKRMAGFLVKCMEGICKIKWIGKRLSKKIPVFKAYCTNVQTVVHQIVKYKKTVLLAFIVQIIAYFFCDSIPFFLSKSVGLPLEWNQYPAVMLSTAFANAAVAWVPTPGATGGIEYAFKIALSSLLMGKVPDETLFGAASAVTLLWRLITYYFLLILSFVCDIIFEGRFRASINAKMKALKKNIDDKKMALEKGESVQEVKAEEIHQERLIKEEKPKTEQPDLKDTPVDDQDKKDA